MQNLLFTENPGGPPKMKCPELQRGKKTLNPEQGKVGGSEEQQGEKELKQILTPS